MRAGARKESVDARGGTAWNDGVHSVDGGGAGNGSSTEAQSPGTGARGALGGDEGGIPQTAWFAPVEDTLECKDGVCPVPWATKPVFTIETPPVVKEDTVNHPSHYGGKDNTYEAIKVIEAWDLDFCLGNVVKYLSRAGKKSDKKVEDLEKALWYLNREIENLKKKNKQEPQDVKYQITTL